MRLGTAALLGLLSLPGCYGPPRRDDVANYTERQERFTVPVRYAPGAVDPVAENAADLPDLRRQLTRGAALTLLGYGPLLEKRAQHLAALLGHPVASANVPPPPRTERLEAAALAVAQREIVADACLGEPQRVGRNLWTFDDDGRQALLPAGCAAASAILAQTANPADVLGGRPPAGAAATPFARAAERYYRRFDERGPYDGRLPRPDETGSNEHVERGEGSATAGLRQYLDGVMRVDPAGAPLTAPSAPTTPGSAAPVQTAPVQTAPVQTAPVQTGPAAP